jgi:hypothetical protein
LLATGRSENAALGSSATAQSSAAWRNIALQSGVTDRVEAFQEFSLHRASDMEV